MYTDVYGVERRYGPPQGWVQRDGVAHFDAAEDWAGMVAKGLDFPAYHGPSSLSFVRGDCLEPLITSQHALRLRPLAPGEQLVSGAFYAIETGASAETSEAVAYREKHRMAPGEKFVIVKCLKWIGSEWYAQAKDSVCRLYQYGAVIAMVVAVMPLTGCAPNADARQSVCGNPFDADSAECSQLGLNAATIIFQNNVGNLLNQIVGAGAASNIASQTVTSPNQDTSVLVTFTFAGNFSAGTAGFVTIQIAYQDDVVGSGGAAFSPTFVLYATEQMMTLQFAFTHSRAFTSSRYYMSLANSGGISSTSQFKNIVGKAEYIQR
jgi:hypothetical protein